MILDICQIAFGSPSYDEFINLRNKILRIPLNLEFTTEQLAEEYNQFHLVAYHQSKLIGGLVLKPISKSVIKMRQVAVDDSVQNKGVGKALVLFGESFSRFNGYSKIELNARDTAIPFYKRLQYSTIGKAFIEVGIAHRKMQKSLK